MTTNSNARNALWNQVFVAALAGTATSRNVDQLVERAMEIADAAVALAIPQVTPVAPETDAAD